MIIKKYNHEVVSTGKYLRLSPYKARRVLDTIRGKRYKEALLILEFVPYRCAKSIKNILKSAGANAANNYNLDKNSLVIDKAFANQGSILKRLQPRAQGKAFPIRKPTCHISISLTSKN